MNASEIDEVLAEALQKNRPVSIQLNQKDYLGRQTESIVGYFRGSLAGNKIFINNQWISLEELYYYKNNKNYRIVIISAFSCV